jgi:hypothetical protein
MIISGCPVPLIGKSTVQRDARETARAGISVACTSRVNRALIYYEKGRNSMKKSHALTKLQTGLQVEHADVLLDVARDAELRNIWLTVIPGPGTAEKYVAKAIATTALNRRNREADREADEAANDCF